LTVLSFLSAAQQKATVVGTVTDRITEEPVELVTVFVQGTQNVAETDDRGRFRILVDPENVFTLVFTRFGYLLYSQDFPALSPGAVRQLDVSLVPSDSDLEVIVTERHLEEAGMVREDIETLQLLPTTTGKLEGV